MARRSRLLDFQVDARDVAAVRRKLQRASGLPLRKRMQRATLTAGDLVGRRVKAAAPRASGKLRRSVKTRLSRRGDLTVLVGPTAPHRHLVILGTRERPSVSGRSDNPWRVLPGRAGMGETTRRGRSLMGVNVRRAGTFTTGRTRPNPFVDRAARGFERKAANLVRKEWEAALR